MRFSDIIGQDAIKQHLINAVKQNKVSQAYIISGEKGCGKKMITEAFASYLLCEAAEGHDDSCGTCLSCRKIEHRNCPDIIYVTHVPKRSDDKSRIIGVDDIREQLNGTIDLRPYENAKKLYIIDEAEMMNVQAQNALLKTLENPPDYAVIMLLSANAWSFLPTIRSRCVRLDMKPIPEKDIEKCLIERFSIPEHMARIFSMFSQGNLGRAISALSDEEFRERRGEIVDLMQNIGNMPYYRYCEKAKSMVSDKKAIAEYYDLISLWFRDVLLYKSTGSDEGLCFIDENFTIMRQANTLGYGQLDAIMNALSDARKKTDANVRADLVMTELLSTIAAA